MQVRLVVTALTAAMVFCGFSMTSVAGLRSDLTGIKHLAKKIPDKRLAKMRGRYVKGNKVMYFGVEMLSHWQHRNKKMTGGLRIDMDDHDFKFRSIAKIEKSDMGDYHESGTTGSVTGNGQNKVKGIVQTIRVAGDYNNVNHDMYIHILGPDDYKGAVSSIFKDIMPTSSGTYTATHEDAKAEVFANGTGAGIKLNISGKGEVIQQLKKTHFYQGTKLTSDYNKVRSVMNITVKLRKPSAYGNGYKALWQTKLRKF